MCKVKVTTKCGEVHFFEVDQEVDTVEIVEEKTRGEDVEDANGAYIFATIGAGRRDGYYFERHCPPLGNIYLYNRKGEEIGFIGSEYSRKAEVK